MNRRVLGCLVVLLASAATAGGALAHHEPKHVKVTILGFSAKQRIGERLPFDAVLPGRTYRNCKYKRLYGFVNFKNMRQNQPFEVVWTLNGRRAGHTWHRWPAGDSIVFDQFVPLRAGVFELFIRTSSKLRARGRVTVACR